jgi:hypothetical protein
MKYKQCNLCERELLHTSVVVATTPLTEERNITKETKVRADAISFSSLEYGSTFLSTYWRSDVFKEQIFTFSLNSNLYQSNSIRRITCLVPQITDVENILKRYVSKVVLQRIDKEWIDDRHQVQNFMTWKLWKSHKIFFMEVYKVIVKQWLWFSDPRLCSFWNILRRFLFLQLFITDVWNYHQRRSISGDSIIFKFSFDISFFRKQTSICWLFNGKHFQIFF